MRRTMVAAGWLLAGVAAVPLHGQEIPAFRSAVDVVTVHAAVRDRHGRPVRGLNQKDFTVLDNGEPRPIVSFDANENAAITVAFLVDVSGSMTVGNRLALARTVSDRMLSAMRAGEDEAALFSFDARLEERQGLTRDLHRIAGALPKMKAFGTTSLYDAVATTATRIAASSSRRAAIVVLTDGLDTSSAMSAADVSAVASATNVPVYVVATLGASERVRLPADDQQGSTADLRDLAAWTGGGVLYAGSVEESEQTAATLLRELRHQYVLGVDAAAADGWRRVEVQVKAKGTAVRARSGYFGGSAM